MDGWVDKLEIYCDFFTLFSRDRKEWKQWWRCLAHSIKIQCILRIQFVCLHSSDWFNLIERYIRITWNAWTRAKLVIELRDYCNIKRLFNLMDYKSQSELSENGHQLRTLLHIKIMSILRHSCCIRRFQFKRHTQR
jgi:hypothetical protein